MKYAPKYTTLFKIYDSYMEDLIDLRTLNLWTCAT